MADLADPRVEAYAKLIVERSLDVQPGWQVLIRSTPLARPLLEELERQIARRGAYAIVRMNWSVWPTDIRWAAAAPEELVSTMPDIDQFACETMDARVTVDAPENTRERAGTPPERLELIRVAEKPFYARTMSADIPWVSCQFPTDAHAQEAGLTRAQLTDILFRSCLLDWDAEGARMRRYADQFDGADEVRIVGAGTDLRLSLTGRRGEVDDGHHNIPGGEFFYCPLEDSAEGVITFGDYPAVYDGVELEGIRLAFESGNVIDASAVRGESLLHSILDTDPGTRRIGELGIGCNPGITHYLRNTLFDEKMDGTIHLALGQSYTYLGGLNSSSIHWDIVKDLRTDGRIELDGRVVQQDGRWLV
jgi:aminopeptidase